MISSIRSTVGSEPAVVMRLLVDDETVLHRPHLRIGKREVVEILPVNGRR